MTQNVFDSRRWVLPLASLVPLLAILYAFSLGPSPRKRLQTVYAAERLDREKLATLADSEPRLFEVLVEDVEQPNSPHREAVIRFLGDRDYKPAGPTLHRLVTTPTESAPVRQAALEALKKVDPTGLRDLAQSLREEAGPLGRSARQLLSELSSGRS